MASRLERTCSAYQGHGLSVFCAASVVTSKRDLSLEVKGILNLGYRHKSPNELHIRRIPGNSSSTGTRLSLAVVAPVFL